MSKAKAVKGGLASAAALLMLSACVSLEEVEDLDTRVSALEKRYAAASNAELRNHAGRGFAGP